MASELFYSSATQVDVFSRLFESVAFGQGRVLYGINLDVRGDGCRIILKTFTDGKAEICFINASTLDRCCEVLDSFLTSNASSGVKWKTDMYYKASESAS